MEYTDSLEWYNYSLLSPCCVCVCVSVGEGVHGLPRVVQLLAAEPLLCVCVCVCECRRGSTRTHSSGTTTRC